MSHFLSSWTLTVGVWTILVVNEKLFCQWIWSRQKLVFCGPCSWHSGSPAQVYQQVEMSTREKRAIRLIRRSQAKEGGNQVSSSSEAGLLTPPGTSPLTLMLLLPGAFLFYLVYLLFLLNSTPCGSLVGRKHSLGQFT